MATNFWLVKQEPDGYSWSDFVAEGATQWTGVRNFQARNFLRSMKSGDIVLFYHSGSEKQIVGIAKVAREAFPDPTAKEGDWSAVELAPMKPLKQPVGLDTIKADKLFQKLHLVTQGRLSVMPVSQAQFERILKFGDTTVHT